MVDIVFCIKIKFFYSDVTKIGPKSLIDNKFALIWVRVYRRFGAKP